MPKVTRSQSIASTADPMRQSQRKQSVQGLLRQFSTFAQDIHESHETDYCDLKHALEESDFMIKSLLDEESKEREEGDEGLKKRVSALEEALRALQGGSGDGGPLKQLKERVDRLEDAAGKSGQDVEALKKAHKALGKELVNFNGSHGQHLGELEERIDSNMKLLNSKAEQTAAALAALEAKLKNVHEGVRGVQQSVDSSQSALDERVRDAERRMNDSVRNTSKDLENLKGDHADLSNHVKQKLSDTDGLHQHLASQKARTDALHNSHSQLLSKHDDYAKDIQGLKDDSAKQRKDISMVMKHVDGALGELAHNTAQELKATRDDVDQILGLVSGVQRAWRPSSSKGQRKSSKRLSDEPGSPKTPKEVTIDLSRHMGGLREPQTPTTPHLL